MREAASWMSGRVVSGDPAAAWSGAALDSRRVVGGELFFALPGERSDGHRFVADALAAGAAGAVVSRPVETGGSDGAVIEVDDTTRALHALTRAMRARGPRRLVAITGSAGKTSTKDLLAALLGHRFRVAKSPGNLNNLYGFPLALLGIPGDTEWMVAEMGMSTPGELGGVSRLGRPDVALFTNVRPVHLEQLGSVEAIARAKAEMLEGLADDGVVIANADDRWVRWIAERHPGPTVLVGRDEDADVRVLGSRPREGAVGHEVELRWPDGTSSTFAVPLHGSYSVENFALAAAAAHHLGVAPEEIAAAAADLRPAAGRGEVRTLASGAVLVDDSYNSNPEALSLALVSAAGLARGRRSWAVLGDMLELGPDAERFHREAGARAAELGFSPVVGVGELSRALVAAAREGGADARWCANAAAAAEVAAGELRGEDLVLVKGSRGVGLEAVVGALAGERR